MRWGPALILSLALFGSASAQPAFPTKPISPSAREGNGCEQYGFLEGDDCHYLALADEPKLPVTRSETKLAFRLVWRRGDERSYQAVVLRFELQSAAEGIVEIFQDNSQRISLGGGDLTSAEIATILDAAGKAGFWTLPLSSNTSSKVGSPNDVETVTWCLGTFTLSGVEADRRRVLTRECPTDKTDPALLPFARALIRVAQHKNSWVAESAEFWPDLH